MWNDYYKYAAVISPNVEPYPTGPLLMALTLSQIQWYTGWQRQLQGMNQLKKEDNESS